MKKITVHLGNRSYPILIGKGLLAKVGSLLKPLKLGSKILIVSNDRVADRFLGDRKFTKSLRGSGFEVFQHNLKYGYEPDKFAGELNKLWEHMSRIPLDRTSTVLALGGGVVGDVAGFATSTYMRGISLVQIPTTLLAQVDSAIGGKTAINLKSGKNIVGSFYQPRVVISDVYALKTLVNSDYGQLEFRNSFAEVIKYGVIQDSKLFDLLEEKGRWFIKAVEQKSLGFKELKFLEEVVWRSAVVKAKVVEQDERETKGRRMILNYGHTFAHALEGVSKFKIPHGEAVACGMILAGELALRMGIFSIQAQARQISLINRLSYPARYSFLSSKVLSFMKRDKKVHDGKLRFVLPIRIGEVRIFENVSENLVQDVLDRYRSVR
ncbi:MAG: 3-dehydroquinate synthase [Candidatus Omnitrophica bacterium]|nr:3-dehydroquinate synthase [Candidatus Omnitrophota bacterium]